jgi:hypothetical protein
MLTIAGAVLVVIGSLLPWATVTTFFGSVGYAGTEGDGKITLVIGLLAAIAAFLELTQDRDTRGAVVVLACAAGGTAVFDLANITDRIATVSSGFVRASAGIGLYAVLAGGGLALCGAFIDPDARRESSKKVLKVLLVSTLTIAVLVLIGGYLGSSDRLTRTQVIAQGDVICKAFSAKAQPIGSDITSAPSVANLTQYAAAFGQLEIVFTDMIDGLRALSPPAADQETYDAITNGLDDELAALREARTAAESGDLTAFNAAGTKIGQLDNQTSQLATTYGFKVCGGGSGNSDATGATGSSG